MYLLDTNIFLENFADDAYQCAIADQHALSIVTFDGDFKRVAGEQNVIFLTETSSS